MNEFSDWVPLITGFGGVAVGALVTWLAERRTERREAARVLWNLQRALSGLAAAGWEDVNGPEGLVFVSTSDWKGVRAAHEAAYAHLHLLPASERSTFRDLRIDAGYPGDPNYKQAEATADSAARLAVDLERVLDEWSAPILGRAWRRLQPRGRRGVAP